jgi:L-threonylcarbamoyladenylate synthase
MPAIFRVSSHEPDDNALRDAARLLRDGLVLAFPTDTLYGLAVDPRNADAVRRLYALKGRADAVAVPLIAANMAQAELAATFDDVGRLLAETWWPGPLTIVAAARPALAREALGGGRTVGVRVPDHPVARKLAEVFGFAVTATSANRSGAPPATRADEVAAMLPDVDGIVDVGPTRGGAPSTIVAVGDGTVRLVRAGAIAWDRVLKSLG